MKTSPRINAVFISQVAHVSNLQPFITCARIFVLESLSLDLSELFDARHRKFYKVLPVEFLELAERIRIVYFTY